MVLMKWLARCWAGQRDAGVFINIVAVGVSGDVRLPSWVLVILLARRDLMCFL